MENATAVATEQPQLYAFDAAEITINLNVRTPEKPLIVKHKLRKPTFAELEERDKKQGAETTTKGQEEFIQPVSSAPDLELWGKLVLGVQGYRLPGDHQPTANAGEDFWHQSSRLAEMIPHEHKLAAIRALHQADYEVLGDDDADVFVIGPTECRIKQTVAGFEVIHTLREMTEAERVEFERKSFQASFVRGKGKDVRTKIQSNLKAYVELYDKLIQRIEGATVNSQDWSGYTARATADMGGFHRQVDALFKRAIINTMLAAQNAVVSD